MPDYLHEDFVDCERLRFDGQRTCWRTCSELVEPEVVGDDECLGLDLDGLCQDAVLQLCKPRKQTFFGGRLVIIDDCVRRRT